MGKFRSKLKGQPKGKRWPKGQSSSSNPETKKYRDQAKSRFFQENLGPSDLTTDALRKHDAISSFVPPKLSPTQMEDDTEESEQQTCSTIKTFASDWSECSNTSFSKLLHIFKPDSAMHKEMLAVLAAVTEVIKQNGGTESSTEYFAALITTLEITETESNLAAVLALLNMGIRSVPHSVLRLKFAKISKLFIDILNENAQSDNVIIIKSLIALIANLLRVQEFASWSSTSTVQIFGSIIAFSMHTKPRIRKAAHHGICSVLKGSSFMLENSEKKVTNHPGAVYVAQFCIQQIESSGGTTGQTTTLHILTLLKDVIHTFPKAQIKSTCETILKVMTLNNPLINSCGMQVLHSLFSAQSTTMPALLNGQLISAIYDYQPAATDVQPTLAWVAVMQQAHIHLSDVDVMVSITTLPKIISTLTQLWLSERVEVMNATTHALISILEDCVAPACADSDIAETTKNHLQKCFSTIESCLGYQYNKAWHQVLHVIAIMFKVGGKHCSQMLLYCLKQLAELRDSYKFSYNNELEFAVGAAVKSMGPDVVLEIISLKKKDGEINIDRSWLLPVLKENVEYSTLEYFLKSILPLALMCHKKSVYLSANNDGIGAHSYELLYIQLWSLLSSFCRYPTDVKQNFKNIAKALGTAISDRKELRLSVMGSIRKLIAQCKETENDDEKMEIARFAKNYLPILFNLYTIKPNGTDEEGQRLAALDTIKEYLSIAPEDLIKQLFANALARLQTIANDENESFTKESVLDLIRTLSSYQDNQSIQTLYDQCIKNLLELKNKKEQKKAYRLLEEICNSESEGCKNFLTANRRQVQSLLMKSLTNVTVSSRGARLRCLNCLVKLQPQLRHDSKFLKSVVPEAVLCCKDINEKCRLAANNLLVSVGETLERHDEMTEYVGMVIAGLAGDTHMITATILAMAIATHNFSGVLGIANINTLLETIGHLMGSSTREIVSACLVYLKIFISSLPSPIVGSSLPTIVKSFVNMTDDCKSHFRNRTRDILSKLIRKYGCDSISAHIPETDTVMHKRLRNIRKIQTRKKKQKEEWKKQQDDDSDDEEFAVKSKPRSMEDILADSDSDFDDMEVDEQTPKQRKTQTWIQEDIDSIIDFTDPSAISKITTTRPGQQRPLAAAAAQQKNKDRGFKTSSDGRLIIGDDSDSDEAPKKGFINLNSDSESEDDNKSAAATAILGNKKRKRSDVESVRSGNSQPAMKYKAGGSGIHRPIKSSAASVYSDFGSEYRSKKAKGDVKKKGKVDPYAYLPLVRTTLNKRKRSKNAGQFKNIVRAAKSGAKKGMRAAKK